MDNGGVRFSGGGVVEVQMGTLQLDGGGSLTNAAFQIAPGAMIGFGATTFALRSGASVSGGGRARVNGATLTLDGIACDVATNSTFELASGTLAGRGRFTGTGSFEWRAGTLNGILELGAGVTLDMAGASSKTISPDASLTRHGLATLSGAGQVNLGRGCAWNNRGTLEAPTNVTFYMNTGGSPTPAFNNAGTFRSQPPSGAVIFRSDNGGVRMNNAGTVEVLSGTLSLAGGGANTNGLFRVAAGAQLDFAALTHEFRDGARLLVDGLARLNGASITCYDTTNTISAGGEVHMSAGALGGAQTFTGPGLFRWAGGSLSGTQTILPGTGFEISGAANKFLNPGARLNNLSSATWLDAGQVYCGSGSVFANAGTLDARSDGGFYNSTGGSPTPRFENTGTLRKSAGTLTRVRPDNGGVVLTNAGVVDVQAGVLSLQGGVALGDGGTFTGAGVASLDSPTTLYGANSLGTGATVRLTSTLYGCGRFDGAGTFNWDSGALDGVFEIASALSLTSGNTKTLSPGAQLTTAGTSAWTGGQIHLGAGAILANRGTFEARCDSVFYMNTGSSPLPVVTNSGTFRKLASTGATTFRPDNGGVTFANAGTVDLRSGTLQLDAGYVPSAGAPFAYLLSGAAAAADHGRVSRSGALPFNGPLTVTLAPDYTPTAGTVFTLASYTTSSGSFHPVNLPALPAPLQWALNYLPTTLELRVLAGAPWLQLTQPAWLTNRTFQALVLGSNVNAVVIQATADLTNWVPVLTNSQFTGNFLFADTNASAFSNRFYRAKQYP